MFGGIEDWGVFFLCLPFLLFGLRNTSARNDSNEHDDKEFRRILLGYQYVAPNLSLGEKLFLEKWWNYFALWIPRWMAPNVVTTIGAVFIFCLALSAYNFSPDLDGSAPWWAYCFVYPICIFVYNTMDGSDGKHARNTRSGSPLGELFDHGVDALVIGIVTTVCCDVGVFGQGWRTTSIIIFSQLNFAFSNFGLLHFGKQKFNQFDGQEGQLLTMLCCIFRGTGLLCNAHKVLFHLDLSNFEALRNVLGLPTFYPVTVLEPVLWCVFASQIGNILYAIFNLIQHYRLKRKCHYNNDSKQNLTKLLHQVAVYILFGIFSMCVALNESYWEWLVMSTFVSSQLTNQILVSRMAGQQFPIFPLSLLLVTAAAFNSCGLLVKIGLPIIDQTVFSALSFLWWAIHSSNTLVQFAKTLNIDIFRIPYGDKKKA
eukprot:g5784.t1